MKRFALILPVIATLIATALAVNHADSRRLKTLSDHILLQAEDLKAASKGPAFDSVEVQQLLVELKDSIKEYEEAMVFAQSRYEGEILLGTTPGGDSTWLETLCSGRFDGLFKEIRIRRTGQKTRYLRINDIEITYRAGMGPGKGLGKGRKQETFNKNGRFKLRHGEVFKLALPRPMKIARVRININHKSTGLEVYGIPFDSGRQRHVRVETQHHSRESLLAGERLLGTTPGGDGTWVETVCRGAGALGRPLREIRLRRTGNEARYLRINDIEVTYHTHQGMKKEIFNKNGRYKLYRDGVFKLALPRPMRITHIRVRIGHKSTGLKVFGVYWNVSQ